MEDLISFIVPVYNVEKYLNKCIESIINQTYKNIEIILINDGSQDNSGKICDKYAETDKRIKVIHKENGGVSSARNEGISNAKGKWISFVDADDWIEENFCDAMITNLKNEECDYAICGYNRVYNNTKESFNAGFGKPKIYNGRETLMKVLNVQSGFGFCHMKLIKSELIKDSKFDEKMEVAEDAFFNLILARKVKKVMQIGVPLYNYRFNDESVVRKYNEKYADKYLMSMKIISEYIQNEYLNDKEINQNLYNFIMYHVLLIAVNYCYNSGNNLNFYKQTESLKKICSIEKFKEAIIKSNFNGLSITRKITLFTLKHNLYYFTMLICKIRQRQFKK